jgi:hypothetical protein
MIYQIFYDAHSRAGVQPRGDVIVPLGVYLARNLPREPGFVYDGELSPNLAEHNTLCEWRALYYAWQHYRSDWVGFTSWRHDDKKFAPQLGAITREWVEDVLTRTLIHGFAASRPIALMPPHLRGPGPITLLNHYAYLHSKHIARPGGTRDIRGMPLGDYHHPRYLEFVFREFERLYHVNLVEELDWAALARDRSLHTWCSAFVARWDYFDDFMKVFSPVVLALLDRFGSHPTDLELCYVCERLVILYNYVQASGLEIRRANVHQESRLPFPPK